MKIIIDLGKTLFFATMFVLFLCTPAIVNAQYNKPDKPMKQWSQEEWKKWAEWNHKLQLSKTSGAVDRREGVMDGNKITTVFYNYGSIGRPNTEPSIEWPSKSTHGYAYEFGPMIGAEVVDVHGDTIQIFSEAMIDGGDRAPGGKVWGWQPLPQFLNTNAKTPAMSNKPDTWPQAKTMDNPFYNPNSTSEKDEFLWPGIDTLGQVSGDLEAFWVMDDRDNDEFEYYPFINDSSRRGLGIELKCRLIQFSAAPAEDAIFYIIEIKNVSDKRLDKVVAAVFGDPHIGGPGDFADDFAGFDRDANMVFSWDKESSGNDYGIPWSELGWLGFKFLESPLDANGNQLGLTSMTAPVYASTEGSPATDDVMWDKLRPGLFDEANIKQESDNVFLFGTGYFSLDPGESQQFSIAILMGKGREDLFANALVAQDIFDRDYKFTKAPDPPTVTAVAGDGEVTIYWDTKSEDSFDDFFEVKDFEGYKIYKSTDKGQTWGPVITNSFGLEVGFKPLDIFDNENNVEGLFPLDKDGVRFNLGKNKGLVHSYKDENVINGVTYFYSVTAFDSGYVSKGILPVESGRFEGQNLVSVMPSPKVPGYENAQSPIIHIEGLSTSTIEVKVLDPILITGHVYEITFEDSSSGKMVANIVDTETGETVVSQQDEFTGFPFIFDGLIASIVDEPIITIIDSLSGWTEDSKSTLQPIISLFPQGGVRFPRDIEIRFYDSIVDTSQFNNKEVNFDVWNTNEGVKLDFVFFDDTNDTVDVGDKIIVRVDNVSTWQVELKAPSSGALILPSAGDIIKITIAKPFEIIDIYQLETNVAAINSSATKKDFMGKIAVVPNPYVVSSSYETPPPSVFSAGRGERRIFFMNIPPTCTIRIYTMNGELLRTLQHEGTLENGMEPWDLLTSEGLDIAYGIYVYHVDAGQYGKKVGKFAIIK